MKVVEIPQYGIEHLRVAERPTPQPGPGQVLLKMKAATLNYRDLMTVNGGYRTGATSCRWCRCRTGAARLRPSVPA